MNTTETARPASHWFRLLQFPLVEILLAVLFLGAAVAVAQGFSALLGRLSVPQSPLTRLLAAMVALLAMYGSYTAYVQK